ncbi:hypothetical protein [Arthrobacter sp. Soil761]|uniref:hypothetical protein n=1 Tax=Arthrobacter sp. Soil761 TaxID=1736400 RepID=UPI0006F9D365|nr:hypothetical protein [Arthrobacter sp. Soil761]KRE66378.1 hypothetical protein ASG79_10245 [Arthrobacter sp. Soil761]
MTARAVASFLRAVWLLAATLAVIAGLLGMHVLTAGHASHGPVAQGMDTHSAAAPAAPTGAAAVVHSAVGDHPGHAAAPASTDPPALAPGTCGNSCPGAQESGAPCVPSVPGGPVTVLPPQATLAVLPLLPAAGNPGSSYGYLPPSPSPCDLSISRT